MVIEELECVTGKLLRGDITTVVYDILKDSEDVSFIIKTLEGVATNAETHEPCTRALQADDSGFSLEAWAATNGQLISL
ncbi:MAG: hypothetical protein LBS29_04995 [Endomicrobium sp.]|jgi:hypothetical protein|nr:hypothetical protein [Endomicrobium sp.]